MRSENDHAFIFCFGPVVVQDELLTIDEDVVGEDEIREGGVVWLLSVVVLPEAFLGLLSPGPPSGGLEAAIGRDEWQICVWNSKQRRGCDVACSGRWLFERVVFGVGADRQMMYAIRGGHV